MSINEVGGAVGDWEIKLVPGTPREILDQIDYWGHIVVSPGESDPERYGDALLGTARYVGPLRGRKFSGDDKSMSGGGMALWLGDEDEKGHIFENAVTLDAANFTDAITAVLPMAVEPGTIYNQTGLYTGVHQYQSSRKALDYITELYDAEWRVNNDGTLDAGLAVELYDTEPTAAITSKIREGGIDLDLRALPGAAELEADMEDFTTRVVLLAQGDDQETILSATADIDPVKNPYKDLLGNTVERTRMVSESDTSSGNAQARATLQLNRFINPRESIKLSTNTHDITGDLTLGGYVWVEDIDARLYNLDNQIIFKGQQLNPVLLRVTELSWPVERGMGVAYRHWDGTWIDLTPYVDYESGSVTVTVGGYDRALTGTTAPSDPIGSVPVGDLTTPQPPEWLIDDINQATYTSPADGLTRAQLDLRWTQPLNTDETIIQDGGYYEIRFRTSETSIFRATHEELSAYRHQNLDGKYESPIKYDVGAWTYMQVRWGTERALVIDLVPGIPYDFEIRAVDNSTPGHFSEWSERIVVQMRPDRTPPSAPAEPQIAASKIAIQVISRLGAAGASGDFTLEVDTNHLVVYSGYEPTFEIDKTPIEDGGSLIGKIPVGIGAIIGEIPVLETFQVEDLGIRWYRITAVDNAGNESLPSEAVQQTAELISDAYISDLTVTKVTAGEISAWWVNAGTISTAVEGAVTQRVVTNFAGIEAFDSTNFKTFDLNSSDGSFYAAGTIESGKTGRRIRLDGNTNSIIFYPEDGETRIGKLRSYVPSNYPDSIAIEMSSAQDDLGDTQAQFQTLPDEMFLNVSKYNASSMPWALFRMNNDWAKFEIRDANANTRDGGFWWTNRDDVWFGIHKDDSDPDLWVDAFVKLGRNSSNFQYFQMTLQPSPDRPGASVPSIYIDNNRFNFIGLRLANGDISSGYFYDGFNGYSNIRSAISTLVKSPTGSTYVPIWASAFNVATCSAEFKEDFEETPEKAIDVLRASPITRWKRKRKNGANKIDMGPVVESLPEWFVTPKMDTIPNYRIVDGEVVTLPTGETYTHQSRTEEVPHEDPEESEGVDLLSWASLVAQAVRELDEEIDTLRREKGIKIPKRKSTKQLLDEIESGNITRRI